MSNKYIVIALAVVSLACSKENAKNAEPASSKAAPSEAVLNVYDAMNRGDSASYLNSISASRQEYYREHPDVLSSTFAWWKDRKADVHIVSETGDGNIRTIGYHLKVTGKDPEDTTLTTQVYLENGKWKYGY